MKVSVEDEEENTSCGIKSCHPKWLQKFANIHCFLVCLSLFSLIQGILVNGLTSASIPHLEREFGLTSTQTGYISSSNDIGGLLFVLFISYYGEKGHKPKWIGYGSILTGIGGLFFALPKFIQGRYQAAVVPDLFKQFETCSLQTNTSTHLGCKTSTSNSLESLTIFCFAQFVMGLGTTPLYTLGAAYLDGNVSPKNSPIYIGIWYMTTFMGPSLGYVIGGVVLNKFVDSGEVPLGLHANSPTWVGRWWLPFITLSWVLLLLGLLFLFFPKSMPGAKEIRQKAIDAGDLQPACSTPHDVGLKGFIKATFELITNKTLVLVILAMTSKLLIGSGIGPFFTKITVIKFGAKPSESNFMVGMLVLLGTGVGLAIGSIIMRKIKVKGSVKVAAFICAGLSLCGVATAFNFTMPGCRTLKLAGVNYNYKVGNSSSNLSATCNSQCKCLKEYYQPLCSNDVTYFSPCFAGCTNKTKTGTYQNCSCVQPSINNTTSLPLSKGKCNQNCKNLMLYIATTFIVLVVSFSNGTPNNMMVLRSVADDRRSFAMGLQFLMIRTLGTLPGPVLVGNLIDSTCIVWKYDVCGTRTNCAEYDLDKLSILISGFLSAANGAACILYLAAYKTYKPSSQENYKPEENNNNNNKNNNTTNGEINKAFDNESTSEV